MSRSNAEESQERQILEDESNKRPPTLGWITPCVMTITRFFSSFGESFFGSRDEAQRRGQDDDVAYEIRRSLLVDSYIAAWLGIEVLVVFLIWILKDTYPLTSILLILPALRAFNILAVAMRFGVFGKLMNPPGVKPRVASHERILVLGFINYLEVIFCAAAFYAADPKSIKKGGGADWFDPIYFSAITQLTIGYGDLNPVGWLRFVACIQGGIALLLLVLFIGRFANLLHRIEETPNVTVSKKTSGSSEGGQ